MNLPKPTVQVSVTRTHRIELDDDQVEQILRKALDVPAHARCDIDAGACLLREVRFEWNEVEKQDG